MPTKPKCYSYIRFSSAEQRKGNSLQRQIEYAQEYAQKNGLILDEELIDEGLSAYKAEHKKHGALGRFLAFVKAGKIPKDSILIVENLDRLSRENLTTALRQFLDLTDAGIIIHTAMDKQTYSKENLNKDISKLYISLGVMQRAWMESDEKSKRLTKAWESKRKNASVKPLTRRLPAWLCINEKTGLIEPIAERAAIIKRIFEMALKGKGQTLIAQTLNSEGIEPWGIAKKRTKIKRHWGMSYIQKILRNKATIGEYQPHHLVDGKMVPVGDIVNDYYPIVIDKEMFYRVQALRSGKRSFRGKIGENRNLFSGLLECGYCGGSVVSADRHKSNKILRYVKCNVARLGKGCDAKESFPKDELERAFLTFCSEIDLADIIKGC